jgi:hypothetical protein
MTMDDTGTDDASTADNAAAAIPDGGNGLTFPPVLSIEGSTANPPSSRTG